jgi:DNA-binding PadR family transcriptional regulator
MTRSRPSQGGTGYRVLKENAARGIYDLVAPMDYMILGFLKDEGTTVLGLYPEGHTAGQIIRDVFERKIGANILAPRLGSLRAQGLIVALTGPGTGGHNAYQVTPTGKRLYQEWKAAQDGS